MRVALIVPALLALLLANVAAGVIANIPLEREVILAPSEVWKTGFAATWTLSPQEVKEALPIIQTYLDKSIDADHVTHIFGENKKEVQVAYAEQIRGILANKNGYRVQFLGVRENGRKCIYCNFIPPALRVGTKDNVLDDWRHNHIQVDEESSYLFWHVIYDPQIKSVVAFDE